MNISWSLLVMTFLCVADSTEKLGCYQQQRLLVLALAVLNNNETGQEEKVGSMQNDGPQTADSEDILD